MKQWTDFSTPESWMIITKMCADSKQDGIKHEHSIFHSGLSLQ